MLERLKLVVSASGTKYNFRIHIQEHPGKNINKEKEKHKTKEKTRKDFKFLLSDDEIRGRQ